MNTPRLVTIYGSPRQAQLYLYVDRGAGLTAVPDSLLAWFGTPRLVMHLRLDAGRKLARVAAADVLRAIEEQGFFLQMPPPPESAAEAVIAARESHPAVGRSDRREGW